MEQSSGGAWVTSHEAHAGLSSRNSKNDPRKLFFHFFRRPGQLLKVANMRWLRLVGQASVRINLALAMCVMRSVLPCTTALSLSLSPSRPSRGPFCSLRARLTLSGSRTRIYNDPATILSCACGAY